MKKFTALAVGFCVLVAGVIAIVPRSFQATEVGGGYSTPYTVVADAQTMTTNSEVGGGY